MFSCQHDKSQEPFVVDGEKFFPVEEYVRNDVVNYESYYSNGEVKKSLTLRDNEVDGLFSSFDSLGNIIRMEHYRMGVLQGERKIYDSRGSLQYLNNYKDGKRDGYQISFDASSDTISFNYCYKDSIIYSSANQENSFKEQILPFIKLLKDTHQVSDTLAVEFGLPIDENLLVTYKHSYTKYKLTVHLYKAEELEDDELIWIKLEDIDTLPISTLTKKGLLQINDIL